MVSFLIVQRRSLHQLIETQREFWCPQRISMERGIALVLAHCDGGLEAPAAGAEHRLLQHGSQITVFR